MSRSTPLTAAILVLCSSVAFAQSAELKNVQFFKGASRDQLVWAMGFIAQSLGVTCDTCHVRGTQGFEFDRDDKETKRTARQMLVITRSINDQFFKGTQLVTCATCHDGRLQPASSNPIVPLEALQARAAAKGEAGSNLSALPPATDLLAKYEQAIGGVAALGKLETRIDEFSATDPTGITTGKALRKAPDKWIETTSLDASRSTTWVTDGVSASITSPAGTRIVTGLDLDFIRFDADFRRTLSLSDRYSNAATTGKETIGGHAAYVIEGQVRNSAVKERLYLDAESGLLLRRRTFRPTLMGFLMDQTDFEDYRVVDGIKVPFLVKQATGAFAATRRYTDIRFNVPVDDAKFSTAPPPARKSGVTDKPASR